MRKPRDGGYPCPNPEYPLYNRLHKGNVSAISTSMTHSGKRRIVRCTQCEPCCSETRDTIFFDLRTPAEQVMMALKMLLVRGDLAGIGGVLGVTAATVLAWLKRGAQPAEAINQHLLRHLPVTQGLRSPWLLTGLVRGPVSRWVSIQSVPGRPKEFFAEVHGKVQRTSGLRTALAI